MSHRLQRDFHLNLETLHVALWQPHDLAALAEISVANELACGAMRRAIQHVARYAVRRGEIRFGLHPFSQAVIVDHELIERSSRIEESGRGWPHVVRMWTAAQLERVMRQAIGWSEQEIGQDRLLDSDVIVGIYVSHLNKHNDVPASDAVAAYLEVVTADFISGRANGLSKRSLVEMAADYVTWKCE